MTPAAAPVIAAADQDEPARAGLVRPAALGAPRPFGAVVGAGRLGIPPREPGEAIDRRPCWRPACARPDGAPTVVVIGGTVYAACHRARFPLADLALATWADARR